MSDAQSTRCHLAAHAAAYPQAEVQDFMKYLYQSSFGCEHLLTDPSAAADYIRREAAQARPHAGDAVEPLDGAFCRVHLDMLREGLSADTLAALFVRSAEPCPDGAEALADRLTVFEAMLAEGVFPFTAAQAAPMLDAWRRAGFPACHHSARFRDAYAPAYRLMKADYVRFLPLFCAVDRLLQTQERLIVAIDGGSASGKSTLGDLLADVYGCSVFHMDDYFLRPEQRTPERYAEPGGNVDRERFAEEILLPLAHGQTVVYRPFDCSTMTVGAPVTVPATRLSVVEGAYSLHPALRDAFGLSVFLDIEPQKQAQRILLRNGEQAARIFAQRWIPLERTYYDACRPDLAADLVIRV